MITVTAISPNSENNCGLLEAVITGTGFVADNAQSATLTKGGVTLEGKNFTVVSATSITCDFELNGQATGTWTVNVIGATTGSLAGFTMTSSNNYCTYADVKKFCHIARNNSNNNEKIKELIPKASAMIDSETNRFFNQRTITNEIHDDETKTIEENKLFPKYFPIISVTSLVENTITLTENTDFYVYDNFIRKTTDFIPDYKGISLTYVAGKAIIPDLIRQICTEITSILANLKIVTYTTDEGIERSVILTTMPDYVKERLAGYRKPQVW